MKRRLLWIVAIVVIAGGIVGGYLYTQGIGARPAFRTVAVTRGPLTAAVSATGTLNAVITVQVGSQVSGQIKELFADFNSAVKKDQVIARIDPDTFEAKVNQAKAQVDAARASVLNQTAAVEKARADLENARAALAAARAQTAKSKVAVVDSNRTLGRNRDLRERGLIAQADEDTAQAAYDSAVAQFEASGAQEQSQTDVPDLSSIEGYPKDFREIQQKLRGMTPEERMQYRQQLMRANREAVVETAAWWLKRMAYGPHPLQEKLALFWHGHFTSSAKDERAALLMWNQNELLRQFAAGNFHDFVMAVARDPAMLDYLNNQQNRKAHPNENFARELMELFTLGIGNYTETDIKQAARAFTGWAHDGDDYIFRKFDHDDGIKTFFGQKGNFNGDDVIEIILRHQACPKYIAGRLFKFVPFLVTARPRPEIFGGKPSSSRG